MHSPTPAQWEDLLPSIRGSLPSGSPVHRTDPSGSFASKLAISGLYPAGRVRPTMVGNRRMNLPYQVERVSFEAGISASANHIEQHYLEPLGITREQVLMFDIMPYFMANTRVTDGRSMADNFLEYERLTGKRLGVQPRPPEADLVRLARSMPGNVDRLKCILARSEARLLLTLGSEAAAFVRGEDYRSVNSRAAKLFYREPVLVDVLGVQIQVVHLAHPGLLMTAQARAAGWVDRHDNWCRSVGRELVTRMLLP
jgi:hypothetical protein